MTRRVMALVFPLAFPLLACAPPCSHSVRIKGDRVRCCMLCVEWPGSTYSPDRGYRGGMWSIDGKAVKGQHHAELCRCVMECICWSGIFRGVPDGMPDETRETSGLGEATRHE